MARRAPRGEIAAAVDSALDTLRRTPRQVARRRRPAVEAAVKQLLRAALGHGASEQRPTGKGEYRIDDLARAAGTTTRNVRAYQERGLLPPPRRVGRTAIFDDSHLARLTIIGSMLERGYTSAHIREMLDAWAHGKDLADVLGLERALVQTWDEDPPVSMSAADVLALAGSRKAVDRLVADKLVRREGEKMLVARPKLLRAFAEMRGYGMAMDDVLDLHERVASAVDEISRMLVDAGAKQVASSFQPGAAPDSEQLTELVDTLARFRSLAMTSVTATLARSIETTVEGLLGDYLEQFLDNTPVPDAM